MRDDMIHFRVTVEGLGEHHEVKYALPPLTLLQAYDPEYVVEHTVDALLKPLSKTLREKLKEELYG